MLSQEHASAAEQRHKAELARLQQDLKQSNARALKSLHDEEHISSAMEELQAQVAALQQESQGLQGQCADYKTNVDMLETKSQQLERELEAATTRVQALSTSLDEARASSLTQQQESEAAVEDVKAKATSKQQELKAKMSRLQAEHQAATTSVSSLREEMQQQQARLDSTKDANLALQQQLEQLRLQHKDQMQSLQSQHAGAGEAFQLELARVQSQAEVQKQTSQDQLVARLLAGLAGLSRKTNEGKHQSATQLLEASHKSVGQIPSDGSASSTVEHVMQAAGCAIMAGNTLLGRVAVEASGQASELTQRIQASMTTVTAGLATYLQTPSVTTVLLRTMALVCCI